MLEYTGYLDESGTTGSNLADGDQPFFIWACVLVPSAQVGDIQRSLPVYDSTLKSRGLWKYKRDLYAEIGSVLRRARATIWYSAVEKRYHLASRIAESYLDTDAHPDGMSIGPSERDQAADVICRLEDGLLKRHSDALRSGPEAVGALREELLRSLGELGEIGFRVASLMGRARVAELMDFSDKKHDEGSELPFPRVTAEHELFLRSIQLLGRLAKKSGWSVGFLEDENPEATPTRVAMFGLLAGRSPTFLLPGAVARLDLSGLKTYASVPAKESPMVQLADLAAGALRYSYTLGERALLGGFGSCVAKFDCDVMASRAVRRKLHTHLRYWGSM